MSTPNENGTPSKRARNDEAQTPNRNPITPSRRSRSGSQQQTPLRTPNRNRMYFNLNNPCKSNRFYLIELLIISNFFFFFVV